MRAPSIRLSFLVAVLALGVSAVPGFQSARAQEPGAATGAGGQKGTVIKGKAPVAKELLRVRLPRPQEFTLKNGARVLVLEDHRFPTVTYSFAVRGGSLYQEKPGVASLTASMLDEGTQSRTAQQIAGLTEEMGATLGAGAGAETAVLSANGPSDKTDELINLLGDVLLHPSFPEDRLQRVRVQTANSLVQQRTNPDFLAEQLASRVIYGDTPYAALSPTPEQVTAVTREDLLAFHRRAYRPEGALLGIAGDVRAADMQAALETALADWKPEGAAPTLPPAKPEVSTATRVYMIARPGSVQTALRFTSLGISRTDPDYVALVVANRVLGGSSSSRLFQNLREERGYTYGAYSDLATPRWQGTWSSYASVRTPVTGDAAREFVKEIRRLGEETVPAEELARAKRALVGSFARTLESPDGVLARATEIARYSLPGDYWDTYPARIDAVTTADVQRVAKKYLAGGRLQVVAVGERATLEPALKELGPLEVVGADLKPAP